MEATGFERMMKRMKNNKKIVGIVKDGDIKISNLINKEKWAVRQLSDPNHKIKSFKNVFTKYNKKCGGLLRGLRDRLYEHLIHVVRVSDRK